MGQLGVDSHSRAVGKHSEPSEELTRLPYEEARSFCGQFSISQKRSESQQTEDHKKQLVM